MRLKIFYIFFISKIWIGFTEELSSEKLKISIKSGVEFLKLNQRKNDPFIGQWPAEVKSVSFLKNTVNIPTWTTDWNIFSSLLVGNSLIEIKKIDKKIYPDLILMQEKLVKGLPKYKFKEGYCFWRCHQSIDNEICIIKDNPLVKDRPVKFACDLDDTALAMIISSDLDGRKNKRSRELEALLKRYKNPGKRGIYTWITHDNEILDIVYPVKTHGKNNPIDCVVNANLLRAAHFHQITFPSDAIKEGCDFINNTFIKNSYKTCGLFYPNFLSYFYSLSMLIKQNLSCLQGLKLRIKKIVLKEQKEDGSWKTDKYIDEYIYSTALAINILLNLGKPKNEREINVLKKGVRFLLKMQRKDGSWAGGSLFSATTSGTSPSLIWKSDAASTASAVEALYQMDKIL